MAEHKRLTEEQVSEMLGELDCAACSYDEWVKVGMALKDGGYDFRLWDEWSARDQDRYRQGTCAGAWSGFVAGGGVTMGTFVYICKEHGVGVPRSGSPSSRPAEPRGNPAPRPRETPQPDPNAAEAHRKLLADARAYLAENEAARSAAEAYLRTHAGIGADRAVELGLGVFTPAMAGKAGVKSRYPSGLWLAFPAKGDGEPWHIDRDIAPGFEERDKKARDKKARGEEKDYYHKYVKPKKEDLPSPALLDPAVLDAEVPFLVEGAADAIALGEHGFAATPLLTQRSFAPIEAIAAGPNVKAVVCMQDNDDDESKGAASRKSTVARLAKLGVPAIAFDWPEGAPKDAGEWNATDPEGMAAALAAAKEAALAAPKPETAKEKASAKAAGENQDEQNFMLANKYGRIDLLPGDRLFNANMIEKWLELESGFGDSISFNEVEGMLFKVGDLPWEKVPKKKPWEGEDTSCIVGLVAAQLGRNLSEKTVRQALDILGKKHRYSPVREAVQSLPQVEINSAGGVNVYEQGREPYSRDALYADPAALGETREDGACGFEVSNDGGLTWEPMMRVAGHVLSTYYGAPRTAYTYAVEQRLYGGIVARALYPGCDFQYLFILHGRQGVGKDTFFRACAIKEDLFAVYSGDLDADRLARTGPGKLVVDVEELDGLKRARTLGAVKSVVSANKDFRHVMYRGDFWIDRGFVLVGTTNDRDILCDPTGNRRFPIVECSVRGELSHEDRLNMTSDVRIALGEVKAFHDRVGKEAFLRWLRLPQHAMREMNEIQGRFTDPDTVTETVRSWVEDNVKVGDQVCITQLLTQALHIPDDQLHRAGMRRTEKAVSAALDNYPGLERRGQQRLHPYGRVTAWRMIREEASS